jgi:hypothetical protein
MKPKLIPWLLPAAALIASTLWISAQRRDLSAIESENQRIATHLAHARTDSTSATDPSQATRSRTTPFRNAKGIDWKQIATAQATMHSGDGMPDMRAMVELQKTLRALSVDEILTGLDEIQTLDLSETLKLQLEATLAGIFAEKDPEAALTRFAPLLSQGDGMISWQLASALKQWSTKDPAAAIAWMDQQIAAGTFQSKSLDGNNRARLMFEASLIQSLISTDPAAAAARLTALPEEQRAGIFDQGMFIQLKPGQAKPIADLIRTQIPENLRTHTLANIASHPVHQDGLERVSTILTEIDASREERKAIATQALTIQLQQRPDSSTTYQQAREWIASAAPEDAAALTGQALANLSHNGKFDEMAAHAIAEQQASGNDQTLAAFLLQAPDSSRDQILKLAENLSDPEQRAQIEARFLNNPNHSAQPTQPAGD